MRVAAIILSACWLFGGSPARAGEPVPALIEAEALIHQAELAGQWGDLDEPRDPAVREVAGTDVERALRALLARCLSGTEECKELKTSGEPEEGLRRVSESARTLIYLLGQYGGSELLPLLWQLEARGSFGAAYARQALQTRLITGALASRPCEPPTPEEVAAERASLGDFAALRVRGGKLVAVRPTSRELEDLAYFLAAVREAGPPVGQGREPGGDWRTPAPDNASLDTVYDELNAARLRGDLQGMDVAARRYLVLLGYPGPLKAREENAYSWHGSRYSSVMREWAQVRESLGAFAEAAVLYRRASPADGACGMGWDVTLKEQLRGFIRASELHSGCRGAVAERLLDIDGTLHGDDLSPYGTVRLREAGFDLSRLYRGALVTRHRDIPLDELKRVLSAAREPLRTAALRRLQERGPEDWEKRVLALEGFADVAQREALEPLLAIAVDSLGETRHRAVAALGILAERPPGDPCAQDGALMGVYSTDSARSIRRLSERCETSLKPPERDAVATRLLPLLGAKDGRTRAVTAEALGRVGSALAIPRLKQLAADAYTQGYTLSKDRTMTPHYPVRRVAAEALERFE